MTGSATLRRRRYALGERFRLKVPSDKFSSVVFLVDKGEPSATGFVVGVMEGEIPLAYVVTARHCVEATAGREFFIRVNQGDGYEDISTRADDWFIHDSADVTAIPFSDNLMQGDFSITAERLDASIGADYTIPAQTLGAAGSAGRNVALFSALVQDGKTTPVTEISLEVGNDVFFVGLLQRQGGRSRNLPVARFGRIARMPSEPIKMERAGGTVVDLSAYLVECHSWGGNSGSPCYWMHPMQELMEVADPRPNRHGKKMMVSHTFNTMSLMGLVSGHWDIRSNAKTEGFDGKVTMKLNSGMAIVTPAAAIQELMMRDDVVEDRKERVEGARIVDARERAMTPDSVSEDDGEFARFEDLTRKLVQTPKSEVRERDGE